MDDGTLAIEFARSERISRGKGGNAVRSAAYVLRKPLHDERLGITYKFKDDGTLEHTAILLPEGTEPEYHDAGTLFNAMERAEIRKDAQTARVVVVALDNGISPAERVRMAEGFARQIFVDRGYPAVVAVHSPHDGGNYHAHLIGGTRQLGSGGFATHKVRVAFTRAFGRPIDAQVERVGELWRDFQNAWFSANGKGISVDPVAPEPAAHIGPIRFRGPNDPRIAANNQAQQINARIARNPAAVVKHLERRPFNPSALSGFLSKHIANPEERLSVQNKVRDLQRDALEKASWADRVQSGLRKLTVEDIARELSPEYATHIKEAQKLRRLAEKAEWVINRQDVDKDRADYRVNERWAEMSLARRGAHLIGTKVRGLGALRDIELERWTNESGRGDYTTTKWAIRLQTVKAKLDVATRRADAALEAIRPKAAAELRRRQAIALNAKYVMDNMAREEKLTARKQRAHNRVQTL